MDSLHFSNAGSALFLNFAHQQKNKVWNLPSEEVLNILFPQNKNSVPGKILNSVVRLVSGLYAWNGFIKSEKKD